MNESNQDMVVWYSTNNSGGEWWLSDEDWKALEAAGWEVDWVTNWEPQMHLIPPSKDGRWLGTLARDAFRHGLSLEEAIAEWERITGQLSTEEGCPCCGPPHNFHFVKPSTLPANHKKEQATLDAKKEWQA